MSASSKNLRNILNCETKEGNKKPKPFYKKIDRRISVKHDNIEKDIYKKLNEGCVLNFLRSTERKETSKTDYSDTSREMNYDLCMINKYDENLNSSLSFISEFDLEEDEKEFDNSFNSSENDNSVEQIDIKEKNIKKTQAEKDEEEINLENEWNDIQELILNKKLS